MLSIRVLATAAVTAVVLGFALPPASARACDDGDESCAEVAHRMSPMKLDQFMKTWKPVAYSKRVKKQQKATRTAAPEREKSEPAAAQAPAPSEPADAFAATTEKSIETDGVAVTSFSEVNEVDAAVAEPVQIVAFNEVNEIDLAAPPLPPSVPETVGQAAAPSEEPADNSWIGRLLLAFAGTIAVAGTARLLIA